MLPKKSFLFVPATFLLLFIFFTNSSSGQIRRGRGGKHGSFYVSAGYNKEKYSNSTINVQQPTLGNNYNLEKVKANNLTSNVSLFPWQLNYRIGYYTNFEQTIGLELNYDPVNYHITDGQNIQLKGTLANVPGINNTITFSSKNGYYYGFTGANLVLLNLVRRFTLFRPNSNKVGIDLIGKVGAGPVMPDFKSSLPMNAYEDPQFRRKGWNAGVEAALRVTVYRYVYLEIAAKYDYAKYNDLILYKGTAQQTISTEEVIASLGFTFPTNRFNPLFHHEHKIITIIPFFLDRKLEDSLDKEQVKLKNDDGTEIEKNQEIPEFQDIVDKKTRRENYKIADSLYKKALADSIAGKQMADSLKNIADSIANQAMIDSIANKKMADSIAASMPVDSSVINAPKDTVVDHSNETKKERKARLKKEKEEQEQKAQQQKEDAQKAQELKDNNDAQAPKQNEENNAAPGAKTEEDKQKKEQDLKEQEQKIKEQEQKEQEQKDKEKRTAEKQAEKDRKAAEKQAKKDKKEQEKKAKQEQKEKEKQEKAAAKEKEQKDKEEQAEKDKKDKEDKDKQEGK